MAKTKKPDPSAYNRQKYIMDGNLVLEYEDEFRNINNAQLAQLLKDAEAEAITIAKRKIAIEAEQRIRKFEEAQAESQANKAAP